MKAKQIVPVSISQFRDIDREEGYKYELINGQVYMQAAANLKHQRIQMVLSGKLFAYLGDKPCSPITDAELKINDNIVIPDLFVYCEDSKDQQSYDGVPIIVVEILSRSTRFKDYNEKMSLYRQLGIAEYWIVNPITDSVTVYNLQTTDSIEYTSDTVLASEVYPDFQVKVGEIFS